MQDNTNNTPSTPSEQSAATPPVVETPPTAPVAPAEALHHEKELSLAQKINRTMAYVLIISGISFVLIAVLAIWNVFGDDAGTVVWRSLGSLGAIALGALIVSVASKIITDHQK